MIWVRDRGGLMDDAEGTQTLVFWRRRIVSSGEAST